MTVDIRGTNTLNKGAQLMVEAVVDRLAGEFELSAPPMSSDFAIRGLLGLKQTLHDYGRPRASAVLGNRVPEKYRTRYGLVADKDISGVVDASGFAYSDSFTEHRVKREAEFGARWASRGVPKVLLPQAFGPFMRPEIRRWSSLVVGQANLVFARDRTSEAFVRSLGTSTVIERSVDFTIGLKATALPPIQNGPFVAIVPNAKMISSGAVERGAYLTELVAYANASKAAGLGVVVIVHESGDGELAQALQASVECEIFFSEYPRELKAAIGQARLLVSSRFHAVVGGLSQGVPSLALGWSHKYEELLTDFGAPEWVVRVGETKPRTVLDRVLKDSSTLARVIGEKQRLLAEVDAMWAKTIDVLRS